MLSFLVKSAIDTCKPGIYVMDGCHTSGASHHLSIVAVSYRQQPTNMPIGPINTPHSLGPYV